MELALLAGDGAGWIMEYFVCVPQTAGRYDLVVLSRAPSTPPLGCISAMTTHACCVLLRFVLVSPIVFFPFPKEIVLQAGGAFSWWSGRVREKLCVARCCDWSILFPYTLINYLGDSCVYGYSLFASM